MNSDWSKLRLRGLRHSGYFSLGVELGRKLWARSMDLGANKHLIMKTRGWSQILRISRQNDKKRWPRLELWETLTFMDKRKKSLEKKWL